MKLRAIWRAKTLFGLVQTLWVSTPPSSWKPHHFWKPKLARIIESQSPTIIRFALEPECILRAVARVQLVKGGDSPVTSELTETPLKQV